MIYLLCNLHAGEPSRAHQETTTTIQSPPRNTSNHPEPTRKLQQPSGAQHEISGTIQSPPGNDGDHLEPTKKLQQPSRAHQEIAGIVRSPARNDSAFEASGFLEVAEFSPAEIFHIDIVPWQPPPPPPKCFSCSFFSGVSCLVAFYSAMQNLDGTSFSLNFVHQHSGPS